MAFVLPHATLRPREQLALRVDPGRTILRAHELHAFRKAEQALLDARAQAQGIVDSAQDALEAERRRGYEEGREEAQLEAAEQMIENVARNVDYFGKVEARMVDLVMEAVQKIIAGYADRDRTLITVRNVLSVVRNQKQMTLRLAPPQVEVVKSRVNELLAEFPGVGYLDIVADARLHADACILESEIGVVEASLEGQLNALRSAFHKVLGSRVSG